MPLRIDTVHSLETRQRELAGEAPVQADYSSPSTKAIKEHILKNFGFWSKTRLGSALDLEKTAGSGTLGRLGASLTRKPMGPEGNKVLKILADVNGKQMDMMDAMDQIGKLERQYASNHAGAPNSGDARAFFATARKIVLMAPVVDQNVPSRMIHAKKAITDIAGQFEQMERVFTADTLQEISSLKGIYAAQQQQAEQAGNMALADSLRVLVEILDSKSVVLQELANVSTRLTTGNPNERTVQDAGKTLEDMAQLCLKAYGGLGELHNMGMASLIGAVHDGFKEYYSAVHRQDMAKIAAMQSQLEKVDFDNELPVDSVGVNGLLGQLNAVDPKLFTQEAKNERQAAILKLAQTAKMKMLLVNLRAIEKNPNYKEFIPYALLKPIQDELHSKSLAAAKDSKTYKDIDKRLKAHENAMNVYSTDRVMKPLQPLSEALDKATSVEQVRELGRRIEDALKTQMEFIQAPNTPVFPKMFKELRSNMIELSGKAIVKEYQLVLDSIREEGGHTLQELVAKPTDPTPLSVETKQNIQWSLQDVSRKSMQKAMSALESLNAKITMPRFGDISKRETEIFKDIQLLGANISYYRALAQRAMLDEDRIVVEAKCNEMEEQLSSLFVEGMMRLPDKKRLFLNAEERKAVETLCRMGSFSAGIATAIVNLGSADKPMLHQLFSALTARLDGKPGSTTELFAKLDVLLEQDPDIADDLLEAKLKLASGMDEKKVRLMHAAAVARNNFEQTMDKYSQDMTLQNLGFYYYKGTMPKSQLRYMLGKIGMKKDSPKGINMDILKYLWLDELTNGMTDDSPLPNAKALFTKFQANLPEPFKSDKNLFAAMAFDAKELRYLKDFGEDLAKLSRTLDGAKELQTAFDASAGHEDIFAARKALENLTRHYADSTSATGEQLMESSSVVRQGLFMACGPLPDELATAFQIDGKPSAEQQKAIESFAAKATGLRETSVLLATRARRQQAECAKIVKDMDALQKTVADLKVDGKPFEPQKGQSKRVAMFTLAMVAAVKGMEEDMKEMEWHHDPEARDRVQARYHLLARASMPHRMSLTGMKRGALKDQEAIELEKKIDLLRNYPQTPKEKEAYIANLKEINRYLTEGKFEERALASLAHSKIKPGDEQKVWDSAFNDANFTEKAFTGLEPKLTKEDFEAARNLVMKSYPPEIIGKALRAAKDEATLRQEAAANFEAAKKSLDETTRAFSEQVRNALSDAVRIAVVDAFLRSDPPLGSAAALREQISNLPDQSALLAMPFFQQCQATLREKLSVPDSVGTAMLIQFLTKIDDNLFKDMAQGEKAKGVHLFHTRLSSTAHSPMERLRHREDTLTRTTSMISNMTEPDAMVTFEIGMAHGNAVPSVAGRIVPGKIRRETALNEGMAIHREGAEFVVTLSPKAKDIGKLVKQALLNLSQAAQLGADGEGMELRFENGDKCAQFLADMLSGELQISSFQNYCSAIDMIVKEDGELDTRRIDIA